MQIDARVGAAQGQDGNLQPPRLTRDLAMLVQDGNGKYYELAYRGQLYTATTAAVGVTIAATHVSPLAAGTGTPIVGLFNPLSSAVNLIVLRAKVSTVSGTPGGPIVWNVIAPNAGISAAGAQGLNNKTFVAGGTAKAFASAATTGSAIGVMFRSVGGNAAIAAGAGVNHVEEIVDGDIVIPPGGFAGLAATAVGTTHTVCGSITWAELPV